MNNIVSTPNTNKSTPNFRLTPEQKDKLKRLAKSRGEYLQDYIDYIFANLDKIDKILYE